MGIWQTIKAALALGTAVPPDARRLNAVDVFALSASLEALLVEERGWITLSEARALFSSMDDDQYAFGEMDEIGRPNLARRHLEQRVAMLAKREVVGNVQTFFRETAIALGWGSVVRHLRNAVTSR